MKRWFFLLMGTLLLGAVMPAGVAGQAEMYIPAIPDEYVDQMVMDGDLSDWYSWIDEIYVQPAKLLIGIPAESLEDLDCTFMYAWSPKTNMFYQGIHVHDDEHIVGLHTADMSGTHKDDSYDFHLGQGNVDPVTGERGEYPAEGGWDLDVCDTPEFMAIYSVMRDDLGLGQMERCHTPDAWYYQPPYCYWKVSNVGNDWFYEIALALFAPWHLDGPGASTRMELTPGLYLNFYGMVCDADSGLNSDEEDGWAVGNCFQSWYDAEPIGGGVGIIELLASEAAAVEAGSWGAIKALFK